MDEAVPAIRTLLDGGEVTSAAGRSIPVRPPAPGAPPAPAAPAHHDRRPGERKTLRTWRSTRTSGTAWARPRRSRTRTRCCARIARPSAATRGDRAHAGLQGDRARHRGDGTAPLRRGRSPTTRPPTSVSPTTSRGGSGHRNRSPNACSPSGASASIRSSSRPPAPYDAETMETLITVVRPMVERAFGPAPRGGHNRGQLPEESRGMVRDGQPAPVWRRGARPGRRARAAHRGGLDGQRRRFPVRIVPKPVVTTPEAIDGAAARGRRRPGLRRRHRLDAHVLAGQDVDRRAAQLRKPLVHLHTQFNRDLPVGGDRHGLHEPAPVRARRPGVRVHPDPSAARPQDGRRPLAGPAGRRATRLRGRGPPPAGTRRIALRIARFGDNMREVAVTEGDKVEAQARLGFSVNGYGVSDLVARGRGRRRRRRRPRSSPTYADRYDARAGPRAGRRATRRAARRRRGSRPGCAPSSSEGGFGAFTDTFEDLGALEQLPGHRRPAADGRRLRLRRRGRLEGRRAGAHPQGHGRRPAGRDLVHGGLHLPPGRSGPRGARGAHARGLPVDRGGTPSCEIHPLSIGGKRGPGPAGVRRRARARRSSSASPTWAIASG